MRIYFRSNQSAVVYVAVPPESADQLDYPTLRLRLLEGQTANDLPRGIQSVLGPGGEPTEDQDILYAMLSVCSFQSPITYVPTPRPPPSSVTMEDLAQQLITLTGTLTGAMRMMGRPRATSLTHGEVGANSGACADGPVQ